MEMSISQTMIVTILCQMNEMVTDSVFTIPYESNVNVHCEDSDQSVQSEP